MVSAEIIIDKNQQLKRRDMMKLPTSDQAPRIMRTILLILLFLPATLLKAADKTPLSSSWSEDFSDAAFFALHWRPYGFLATGIDAEHPLGKTVSGKDARLEWWQIVDGALRGQCFPEEKHPPGLRRAISGTDIRLRCRFKIAAEGQIGISIGGPNPIVERDFNVAGLHIRPDGITAWDNDVLHPKGSPEAAELKSKGIWNRKFFYAKTAKLQIASDALVLKLRGKYLRVILNKKPVLTYTTLCGHVEILPRKERSPLGAVAATSRGIEAPIFRRTRSGRFSLLSARRRPAPIMCIPPQSRSSPIRNAPASACGRQRRDGSNQSNKFHEAPLAFFFPFFEKFERAKNLISVIEIPRFKRFPLQFDKLVPSYPGGLEGDLAELFLHPLLGAEGLGREERTGQGGLGSTIQAQCFVRLA